MDTTLRALERSARATPDDPDALRALASSATRAGDERAAWRARGARAADRRGRALAAGAAARPRRRPRPPGIEVLERAQGTRAWSLRHESPFECWLARGDLFLLLTESTPSGVGHVLEARDAASGGARWRLSLTPHLGHRNHPDADEESSASFFVRGHGVLALAGRLGAGHWVEALVSDA